MKVYSSMKHAVAYSGFQSDFPNENLNDPPTPEKKASLIKHLMITTHENEDGDDGEVSIQSSGGIVKNQNC